MPRTKVKTSPLPGVCILKELFDIIDSDCDNIPFCSKYSIDNYCESSIDTCCGTLSFGLAIYFLYKSSSCFDMSCVSLPRGRVPQRS